VLFERELSVWDQERLLMRAGKLKACAIDNAIFSISRFHPWGIAIGRALHRATRGYRGLTGFNSLPTVLASPSQTK